MRVAFNLLGLGIAASLALLAGCDRTERGPLRVSGIGGEPRLVNPNLQHVDAPAAFLLQETAQGLVRFSANGEIEPALAQRWIVSDDGIRYTFRLGDATWRDGSPVTAEQVAGRLRAAASRASRNPLKPLLGAIAEIEAMTDEVIEISLRTPRPNFLQLLAQPQMAIVRNGIGSGPYRAERQADGTFLLSLPPPEDEDAEQQPSVVLRGERAPLAIARFEEGLVDFVTGGTAGDLPIVRAARPAAASLRFDPSPGLLGLAFVHNEGPLAEAEIRQALSMAVDRAALVAAMGVPGLDPRTTLLPPRVAEMTRPTPPAWMGETLDARRERARATIARIAAEPITLRLSLPPGPGYDLLFAHLRRDWRLIGVRAERVAGGADADLRLIDQVAAADLATWYLRFFTCEASRVCDPEADRMLAAARVAATPQERATLLAGVDTLYAGLTPFIPLSNPVRWSLVGERVTGFAPNPFAIHPAGALLAAQR